MRGFWYCFGRLYVMFRVASANVNGIRAAARRGGLDWLRAQDADVICLQEVRADDDTLRKVLADNGFGDWDCASTAGDQAGRAGVAILARAELTAVVATLPNPEFDNSGRWIQAQIATDFGRLTLASTYVHAGEAGTGRQEQKYRFLTALTQRLAELQPPARSRAHALVAGDFNIARTAADIKNWRGNIGRAGFLPQEQEYLDGWFATDWTDTGRAHAGDVDGPYTWWSWRGQAFDNDTGWRIDYVMSSRGLARKLADVSIGRAPTYAQRWSDHAAVMATFDV